MDSYGKRVGRTEDWAKITAATTALLAGQDVGVATHTATTAVENNFLILAQVGITTACIAYEAYRLNHIYETEGPVAALQALGIDVAALYVGGVAIKAVTPALRTAISAALDKMPGLKTALGGLVEKIVIAAEGFAETKLGRGIEAVESGMVRTYDKVAAAFGRGVGVERAGVSDAATSTTNFLRELRPEDLGVKGYLAELRGTFSMADKTATVRIDMIDATVDNTMEVINNLSRLAKSNGAEILKIEGTIANDDLLSVLSRRYKSRMLSEGANEIITIPLK